jgi:polynucleotide 5'-hydroxyl-kinase GRC3/NOL9
MSPSSDLTFPFLKNLDLPPAWEEAARRFLKTAGATMVLGGPDAGKSTLCNYLVYRAYVAGEPVGLVDLDLGQSHLGPPAALGLGLFPPRFPGDRGLFPEGLYFIGQTSPVGAILEVAVGSRVLADQARARGVNRLVVNTSGLVKGCAAHRLKRAEVELLQPELLLALDRDGELAPLLRTLDYGADLLYLPVSARSARRGFEERRQYREARFGRYLAQAQPLALPLTRVAWQGAPLGWGEPLSPAELSYRSKVLGDQVLYGVAGDSRLTLLLDRPASCLSPAGSQQRLHLLDRSTLEYRLVGLWDRSGLTLALGLLLPSPWQDGLLQVLTPLPASRLAEVRGLSLGRLKLSPNGRELTAGAPQT